MKNTLSLVYIIGTYPGLTTTFIDREITCLRQWGMDLQIVAIRRPPASTPLSNHQKKLQQDALYLLPVTWLHFILSHFYFVFRYPLRYFGVLIYLLTRAHPDLRAWFMTGLHFAEGVYAAYLVRQHQFHELHAHFVDRAATVALVAGRLLNKSYSLSIHAGPDIFVKPILLPEKIMGARHIATCTRYNMSHIETIVGQDLSSKVTYIHHGLDLAKYAPPSSPVSGDKALVLSVGQLAERKGFAQLIRACHCLRNQGYDFVCHIVGHGPQRQDLEDLIAQLKLGDIITLCGALPHEEVIEKYRRATMFVLPCIKSSNGDMDGIPNVLAEAMAMRVPVISTKLSAIPELLEAQVNGILVPPTDETALVTAMACLLDDPVLRKKLGNAGRKAVIENFDLERNIRQFAMTLWPEWFQN